jgi:hypothetical protein
MEKIWLTALNKKLQKKALAQKRSAMHAVMQNKFTGNLGNPGAPCLKVEILFLTCLHSRSKHRFVPSLCGE